MVEEVVVTAAVLVIGNEILSGRTRDANLNFLAVRLNELGIRLREARVVTDDEDAIVAAVNALRAQYDYVFTSGGIGPTHDDITSASVAKAFGQRVVRRPDAVQRLAAYYPEGGALNAARLRMADLPEDAELVDNPVSGAPGFRLGNVIVLAGVPPILQAMFEGLAPRLVGGTPLLSRTVSCPLPEGLIAEGLAAIQGRFPAIAIGSYPYVRAGGVGTSLVLRGADAATLATAAEEVRALIRSLGVAPIDTHSS